MTAGWILLVGVIGCLGCGASSDTVAPQTVAKAPVEVPSLPALLDRPFTAEQIRDEWVEGFQLRIRQWTPEIEAFERWTVVRADSDGVDIESVPVDAQGAIAGESKVQTSSWVQLRDHASFPADRGKREAVSRDTPLGELNGWLYSISDPGGGAVTEFFFPDELPGAPVFVHVLRDGEIVEIFEQVERSRP